MTIDVKDYAIVPRYATTEMFNAFFAEDYTQNGYVELIEAAPTTSLKLITEEAYDALVKDAERYRHLRDTPWTGKIADVMEFHRNALFDSVIDEDIAITTATQEETP